ncbi:MAG: hypothetical protein B7Z06_10200, partial [Flavobacteriales bacterium 32-35-8]
WGMHTIKPIYNATSEASQHDLLKVERHTANHMEKPIDDFPDYKKIRLFLKKALLVIACRL